MKFLVSASAAAALFAVAISGAAFAGDKAQNANAKTMNSTIKSLGNGSVPAKDFTGGWGNIAGPAKAQGKGQNNVAPKSK